MRIEVAGAGSGKTSSMASRVLSEEILDGRVLFCVAFTNAAVLHIESKLVQMNGSVPSGVRVSTIHSFLNTEIVQPYYHLLFGKRYDSSPPSSFPETTRHRMRESVSLNAADCFTRQRFPREPSGWSIKNLMKMPE